MIALLLLALVACAPDVQEELLCTPADDDGDGLKNYLDDNFLADFYYDNDEDGYGDPDLPFVGCEPELNDPVVELGYATDCDDEDPEVYPGAQIVPGSGLDNNCDGWSE